MKANTNLICVYTGTELTVNLLKDELDLIGVSAMIQNNFSSGISAGFSGGVPSSVDLFIQESDLEKAKPNLIEFAKTNHW